MKKKNKREHTPGPWTYGGPVTREKVIKSGTHSMPEKYFEIGHEEDTIPPALACAATEPDARLIAAAPDLLAAIRGLLDMATDNRTHGLEIMAAVMAIDKAEGR